MTKDQLIEQQQHALYLASKMANCALVMTGGYGPVATFQLIQNVLQLSDELLEYVDEPPNLLAVINAGKELQKLSIYQLLPKCVSAMGDGGICLTWPLESFYGGLSCYNDGDITLNYRVRSGESTRVINPTCQDLSTFAAVMRECH
jgi:hypothetical protein